MDAKNNVVAVIIQPEELNGNGNHEGEQGTLLQ